MRGAARISDLTAHMGPLATGDPSVLINGKPAVRIGDMQVCPTHGPSVVVTGAPLVFVGNAPLARILDLAMCSGSGKAGSGGGGGGGGGGDGALEGPTYQPIGPNEHEAFVSKTNTKRSFWIFESETTSYLGYVKGEGDPKSLPGPHQMWKQKDGGGAAASGHGGEVAAVKESTTYKIMGVTVLESETKALAVEAQNKGFVGEQDGETGLSIKGGAETKLFSQKVTWTDGWVHAANALLEGTGYDVQMKSSAEVGVGEGTLPEVRASHKDGRFHFVSNGVIEVFGIVGVGFEGSIGKTAASGPIPNPITMGSPNVLVG